MARVDFINRMSLVCEIIIKVNKHLKLYHLLTVNNSSKVKPRLQRKRTSFEYRKMQEENNKGGANLR